MDSSTKVDPLQLITEEEISKLKTQRVSLVRVCSLLGHSYPHIRRLVADKKLITIPVGKRQEVTLYEIRRFAQRGNATPKDWAEFEGQ